MKKVILFLFLVSFNLVGAFSQSDALILDATTQVSTKSSNINVQYWENKPNGKREIGELFRYRDKYYTKEDWDKINTSLQNWIRANESKLNSRDQREISEAMYDVMNAIASGSGFRFEVGGSGFRSENGLTIKAYRSRSDIFGNRTKKKNRSLAVRIIYDLLD